MDRLHQVTIYRFDGVNYIGSTKQKLNRRQGKHKSDCFNVNSNTYDLPLYKHIRTNNMCVKLIPIKVLFLTKKSGRMVEQYYIDKYNSVKQGLNTVNALVDKQDYKKRQYLSNVKSNRKRRQKINAKARQHVECDRCGRVLTYGSLSRHRGRKTCLKASMKMVGK